jgi:hypothetical protein
MSTPIETVDPGKVHTTTKQPSLAPYEVSILVAAVAAALAYLGASGAFELIDSDGHGCMDDACKPTPFVASWIAQWAIIGLILSPIALWYGRGRGRNWPAWSRFALAALPSIPGTMLLSSNLLDARDVTWAVILLALPVGLWLAGAVLSALWITRGEPAGTARLTTGLVAGGYATVATELVLLTIYMEW